MEGPIPFGEQELSWEFLLEEWEAYKYYGATMALIFLPCMCANPEHIPDMETMEMHDFDRKADDKFSEFLNMDFTMPRVANLAKNHLPA